MPELYVAGTWVTARAGGRREIRCPADGSLVAEVDEASSADTEDAIGAARSAFDEGTWPGTPQPERAALLLRIADLLQRDRAEIARMESLDTGKRIVESEYDVDDVTSVFRHYGQATGEPGSESALERNVETGQDGVASRIVREPLQPAMHDRADVARGFARPRKFDHLVVLGVGRGRLPLRPRWQYRHDDKVLQHCYLIINIDIFID